MKRFANQVVAALVVTLVVWSCGPKKEPEPNLPSYLRVPATLTGYAGSGLITTSGDLSLRAEGPEVLDAGTKTYSGVLGRVTDSNLRAQFTVGQPLPYSQTSSVPPQYESNGQLYIFNAITPGTYPMGIEGKATPTGASADIILNLPGPQLYSGRLGTLTITESTIIKTEGDTKLYRLQGNFQTTLITSGAGTVAGKNYAITGTFDLLLRD